MTYVEFFDRTSVENICACLSNVPEKVILIGAKDDESIMGKYVENYKKVFGERKYITEFLCEIVDPWTITKIAKKLEEILHAYNDCVFGIAGGDEMTMYALGVFCGKQPEGTVQVHKVNVQNSEIYDCDMDGKTIEHHTPKLSVKENIRIYGGDIIESAVDGNETNQWNMTPDFRQDIENMWSICKSGLATWNQQIGLIKKSIELGASSNEGLVIEVSIKEIENACKPSQIKPYFLEKLAKKKLLKVMWIPSQENAEKIRLIFKNEQIKKSLSQEGLALELKIYSMCKYLRSGGNGYLYNDVMNGVQIDWDGVIRKENEDYDTTNEIDVLLMHNMVPVFVSCKNGTFDEEEFYKLCTVAERFGGKYSKKVLVASQMTNKKRDRELKQKAFDMGIQIIAKEDVIEDSKLQKRLEEVWKS